jgi:alkylation response protein AidB-like acyl-CoA dehydrogenase
MRVELPDQYYDFAASVSDYLEREWTGADVRSYWDASGTKQRSLWSGLAGLGLFALTVPVEHGGEGLPLTATAPVLEHAGRQCLPHPIAETVAVVTPALAEAGTACAAGWLSRIANGTAIATVQDGWNAYSPWATDADIVLVIDRSDTVHLCSAASVASRLESTDPSRRLGQVGRDAIIETLTAPNLGQYARARATAATAVVLTGCALQAIERTVEYAKIRTQFGRTIGSFQAIKHLLANAYFAVETNRRFGWIALSEAGAQSAAMFEAVSIAKLTAGEAAQQASYAALQVHGGIGYTWDFDLHFWLKRIQVLDNAFGTPDEHARRLATLYEDDGRVGLTSG